MRFLSEKSSSSRLAIWGIILWFSGMLIARILPMFGRGEKLMFLIFLVPIFLLLWIWFSTYYAIESGFIKYLSGPFFGKIDIASIRKREVNKTLRVGFRPALGTKGIVVYFNKYGEIYFSPKYKKSLIEILLSQNPQIVVKEF